MQALAVLAERIEAGATIGSNWIAEDPLQGWPGVQRWSGISVSDGEPVEILRLTPEADPIQQQAFLNAHRALAELPAGMPLLYTGRDSTIVRPYARTSLAELDRRLSPAEAVALAGWYGPAILALENATGPVYTADTFVIDRSGVFRLAPLGRSDHEAPPLPPEQLPPELRGGGEAHPCSGLYGLGVALYRALTGSAPVGSTDHNGQPLPPPPPSQARADLDHRADRVVMALLDEDPARRSRALPPPPLHPPRFEPGREEEPPGATGSSPAGAPGLDPSAAHLVVLAPQGLRPAAVRKAASWMGVSAETAGAIAREGLPLPVYAATSQADARRKVSELRGLHLAARAVSMRPTLPLYTLVWSALLLGTGGVAWMIGLPSIVPVLAAVLGGLAVPAAIGHDIWYARRVRLALERLASSRAPAGADPETEQLLWRTAATLERLRILRLDDHSESDLIAILEMTLAGLKDLAEAERQLPPAARGETAALRGELKRGLECIEVQTRAGARNPESAHEVELETMLTRAMAARRRASQLIASGG